MAATLPLTYYVQFRDAAGNIISGTDGKTWFAVNNVDLDLENTVNLSGGGGSAAGRPTLNPLTFTLGTDTIDPTLLAAEGSGATFSQVELAGYSGAGSDAVLVTDDVVDTASVGALGLNGGGLDVALNYESTVQGFYPTDAKGNVLSPVAAGYDSVTLKPDASPAYTPAAPLAGVPSTVDTSQPLSYYVQFRDTSGNPIASSTGQTWFAISNLAVSSARQVNVNASGTGSGSGALTFDPVSFTLDPAGLPSLLGLESGGFSLGEVEIAGYTTTAAGSLLAEDLLDRKPVISALGTGPDGSQTVALATNDLVQTVANAALAGTGLALSTGVSKGWDTVAVKPDNTPDTQATAIGAPPTAPAQPLTYYVQFRSGNGTLLSGNGGQTWFAATDVSFGSAYKLFTGAAPVLSFDPLTLTLQPDIVLAKLFADQAAGMNLQSVEVAGYTSTGALDTDDTFKLALPLDDTRNADGSDSLVIGYKAFTQTSVTTATAAGQTTSETQGYNLLTKAPDNSTDTATGNPGSAPDASASSVPPTAPAPGPITYYVQFRGANGALLAGTGGRTWFAVTDANFSTNQTQTTGGGAGKVTFGPLSFTLGADSVLPALFGDEASGTALQSLELAGYAANGTGTALVTDDLFKSAAVATDTPQPDGTDALSFQYGGLLETTRPLNADGTTGPAVMEGWNQVTNRVDNTTAPINGGKDYGLSAPLSASPAVATLPGPLTYFVQFRGYGGSYLADASGSTWFAISNLQLPTSSTVSIGSQSSGVGASSIQFGPVSFSLVDPTLEPKLFLASATGTPYESVEIAGYASSGATATLVQDDILKLAAVQSVQAGDDSSTALSLAYGGLVERSYSPDGSGNVSQTAIAGWNKKTNSSDTTTSSLATTPGGSGTANGAIPVAPTQQLPAGTASASPLTYFIEFVPNSKNAALADSSGTTFIPVRDLSFTTTQTLNIGSQTTGAGAGRIDFSPLTFTIAPDSLSTNLLSQLTSGTPDQLVYLVGYSGNDPVKTTDDVFKSAYVSQLTTNSDGSETVSLDYAALQERVDVPSGTGSAPTPVSAGWNEITDQEDTSTFSSGAPDVGLPNGPACYCPGTRIATPSGEVPIEQLAVGDAVLTTDGRVKPILWIGRRSYRGRFVLGRRDILPVTIAAGALADGVPARDLTVSPEHAMLIDGLLVPAHLLVNGTTVTQAVRVDEVHYLHLELERHEAILAEGAAAETFIDDDSRGVFHNASEWKGERRPARFCAPRVEHGYELEAIRTRIASRSPAIRLRRAG